MKTARIVVAVAGGSIAGFAGTAGAAMTPGSAYTLTQNSAISVEFVSQDAGARGNLYFLGHQSGSAITYAADSDSRDLGQYLFTNHTSSPGDLIGLGNFAAGSILHFAYIITNGGGNAPTGMTFRTDLAGDLNYYSQETYAASGSGTIVTRFGVEDIRGNSSDWDYNDLIFNVVATPVPTPGPTSLLAVAGFFAFPRARRR